MNTQKQQYTERVLRRKERDPVQRVVTLVNQYWSIDQLVATDAEKQWAKERLYKQIMGISRHLSNGMQGDIKASLNNKSVWESVRERIA
jgi:hypothetical protein